MVQEVNVRVLGKRLELLSANGGRFWINQLYLLPVFPRKTGKLGGPWYICN